MAYTLTCYGDGGVAAATRVGERFATVAEAKRAAGQDAGGHGRLIRAWTGAAAGGGALTWARGGTTDAAWRYIVEWVLDEGSPLCPRAHEAPVAGLPLATGHDGALPARPGGREHAGRRGVDPVDGCAARPAPSP
jgi:hypothetical protein